MRSGVPRSNETRRDQESELAIRVSEVDGVSRRVQVGVHLTQIGGLVKGADMEAIERAALTIDRIARRIENSIGQPRASPNRPSNRPRSVAMRP